MFCKYFNFRFAIYFDLYLYCDYLYSSYLFISISRACFSGLLVLHELWMFYFQSFNCSVHFFIQITAFSVELLWAVDAASWTRQPSERTCYWKHVDFQDAGVCWSCPADGAGGCCWSTAVPAASVCWSPVEVRSADWCPAWELAGWRGCRLPAADHTDGNLCTPPSPGSGQAPVAGISNRKCWDQLLRPNEIYLTANVLEQMCNSSANGQLT